MTDSRPILVCGMHRSGTSLAAALVGRCGVRLGLEMIPADERNRHGYFEDAAVVRLHQEMLQAATARGRAGHPDWGWTEDEVLDRSIFERYRERASELISERAAAPGPWGFKDPRTTVALDFWERRLGERAKYVFVYRFPWQVADSMQRLGADVFLRHPGYAYRIWTFYNRQILDFYRRNRERCVLASTNTLVERPERFVELLRARLGLEVDEQGIAGVVQPGEWATYTATDPIAAWTLEAYTEVRELCRRLDETADLPNVGSYEPPARVAVGSGVAPRVSVVVPCLDHGELLLEAIASVERSITLPYEVIVVDDGSTASETLRILDRLRCAGYKILVQENRGLAAARNVGIEQARAPYILPLDADNRIRSGFIERAIAVLDAKPKVGIVYGDRNEFGGRDGHVKVGTFDLPQILWANYIDACALFRRQVWSDVGGYDEELDVLEDWGFWISAGAAGWGFEYLEVLAFDYRVRPDSLVRLGDDPEVHRRVRHRVFERNRPLYEKHSVDIRADR